MTTPGSARLEAIARELQSTVRSLMAKAEHTRDFGPHACREAVYAAILAAFASVQSEPTPASPHLIPLGTMTQWGKVAARIHKDGERYYMLMSPRGIDVALLPADVVEGAQHE